MLPVQAQLSGYCQLPDNSLQLPMDFSLYDNHYIRRFEQIISSQNDNSNSSNASSTKGFARKPRAQLTEEQREMINSKRRISALSADQRERRNQKRRISHLTPEQRERINSKRRVSALTPEQREERNAKRRVASLTPEQREKRNQKRRISSMTSEQRALLNLKRRRTTVPRSVPTNQVSNNTSTGMPPPQQQQLHHSSNMHGHHQTNHKQSQQTSHPHLQAQDFLVQLSDPSKAAMMGLGHDSHSNHHLGASYDLFRQKLVQYTPEEMQLINSIRNNTINMNRRC